MKIVFSLFALLIAASFSYAQNEAQTAPESYKDLIPGAIASRPANMPGGKILTMEETILSRDLSPTMPRYEWKKVGGKYVPQDLASKPMTLNLVIGNGAPVFTLCEDNALLLSEYGEVTTIAADDDPGIVYGQTVSRNEFGINDGVFWSPDSTKIAFYRKDERAVTEFPMLNIKTRTGSLKSIRYPMAGMDSEVLRLCVFDRESRDTLHLKVTDFGADRYLTNVTWSPRGEYIFIQVLDRSQKHCRLNMYDASTGEFVKTLLTEDNDKYVEPLDPLYFMAGSNDKFIYRTANRDGYRNLYLCDIDGNISRLTQVDADVQYVGNDGRYVFYTVTDSSPIENNFYRIDTRKGKTLKLTTEAGWHRVSLSPDCAWFTDSFSSLVNPGRVYLCSTDGRSREVLYTAEDPTLDYSYGEIVLGSVKSADGQYDNHYRLVLPKDFDPSQKYPLILYVYGGPHSQMVRNGFMAELRRWEMYMAQRGYILYIQDNRGTDNQGLEYEQAIHRQCGQAEMADQMEGMKMLMGLPFVDTDRIGVHGWSYGGFMTISLVTNYPDVFKVAVAGGPVIDWKWYEVMYGERYMDNPNDNKEGYDKTSLINKAADLKGKLLICQGGVDNTVVMQNCLNFIQKCIDKNVQVDFFPYPTAEHNMFGKERVHLMNKVTEYFEKNL